LPRGQDQGAKSEARGEHGGLARQSDRDRNAGMEQEDEVKHPAHANREELDSVVELMRFTAFLRKKAMEHRCQRGLWRAPPRRRRFGSRR